ncbi:DNA primase [Candidatus Aerophobetes bacterium]|nr:DNA primase [Candidatus Aerophobetes bacterium]
MAIYISNGVIDKIIERTDIVELIGNYLPLKRVGKNYKALCPFHQERTPSFVVSPEKQLFHCFGCGVGGNVISFLMKWEKISFPEAVKMLGDKLGMSIYLSEKEKKESAIKDDLYQTNEMISTLFQEELRKDRFAQEYLVKRGFNKNIVKTFKLGYVPSSRNFLRVCEGKGISFKNLRELGLISEDGNFYFKRRLIFPIFTPIGRICGFGGRVLDNSLPKYLNSPQSRIFKKGENLYGLNLSKEVAEKEKEVILVEGYTDVIALYQMGLKNVVASLGTSLTSLQSRLIKRYANQVFIAYDEDIAGSAATLRGIDLLLEDNLRIRVISMPQGMDPGDFLRKKEGKEEFIKRKRKALSYFDYRLNLEIDHRSSLEIEEKIDIVNNLFPTLQKIRDLIKLQELIKKLAFRLDLDESLLTMEFKKFNKKRKIKTFPSSSPIFNIHTKRDEEKTENMLLQLMLMEREVINIVIKEGGVDNFTNPSYRKIAQKIILLSEKEDILSPSKLISQLEEEDLSSIVSSFCLTDTPFGVDNKEKIANDFIKSLKRIKKQKRITELIKKIEESEEDGKEEKVDEWSNELIKLKKQILLR